MNTSSFINHVSCVDYETESRAGFEFVNLLAGEGLIGSRETMNVLLFCIKGKVDLHLVGSDRLQVPSGFAQLIPMLSESQIMAEYDSEFLLLNFQSMENLCDRDTLKKLKEEAVDICYNSNPIEIHKVLLSFLNLQAIYQTDGLLDLCLHKFKQKELFALLQASYTKQELVQLFYPLLCCDQNFKEKVYANYTYVKNVKEFADIMNYGYFDFRKKFLMNFGISAYRWMQEQKMHEALTKLQRTDTNLTLLSEELGFSSISHFNKFFKQRFGIPPGRYRTLLHLADG